VTAQISSRAPHLLKQFIFVMPVYRKFMVFFFSYFSYWFPEKAYDAETEKMVKINISDWLVEIPHKTECQPGERLEVIFDMKRFMFLKDGSLLVSEHNKLFEPLQFCVDHELGI
jgi:hypothetical protein